MTSKKYVWLTNDPEKAHSQPVFVIKQGNVYYQALALWKYDINDAETQKQIDGCNNVAARFAMLAPSGLDVREWDDGDPGGGGDHTK